LILLRALKDLSAVAEVTGIVKRTFTALWMLEYNSGLACLSLIPSKLASLTPERELHVFMPFAGDLPDNNFAAYKAEMVRWKCKWQNVTEKPSTLIDTLKHAKPELYPNKNNETNKGLKQIWVTRPQQQTRYIQVIAC
jgi:hypothetical protein